MAARRDYAKKPRSSTTSRRSSGGRSKKGGGAPVWVWLATGLLGGMFIAFLIFLQGVESTPEKGTSPRAPAKVESGHSKPNTVAKEAAPASKPGSPAPAQGTTAKVEPAKERAPATVANATPGAKPQSAQPPEPAAEKPALNYDFYKILPKSEVVVPEEELRKPANSVLATAPGTYYLQVGAFRRMEEADSRKAELAMLGIVSAIQTVTVEAGNSWHRVRIGPVKEMNQLDRTKRQLQENNIAFVTLKESR